MKHELIKKILEKGKISKLASDTGKEGWSGEVHLSKHKGRKYVLRICKDLERAKRYEIVSRKLEKYGFLPKFLGRIDNKILYEYIEGRDLRKKESCDVIKQVGKICARINKVKASANVNKRFKKWILGIKAIKRPLLSNKEISKSQSLYNRLKKKLKPKIVLDAADTNPKNFRLRKDKVYIIDIEAINPTVKLFGVGKAFLKWFKSPEEQKFFKEGYRSVDSLMFFTKDYEDFIYLNFLVQDVYLATLHGKKYKPSYLFKIEQLRELLNKYNGILR